MGTGRFLYTVCLLLPWHSLRHVEWVSRATERVKCKRCGREFGMNHDARVILPWPDVARYHDELGRA